MLKESSFALSFAALLFVPFAADATSTAPYLEVTYTRTVQIPITEMDGMNADHTNNTWNNLRSASNGTLRGDPYIVAGTGSLNSGVYVFMRSFYTFDTSSIPDDAVIDDASLNMYVQTRTDDVNNAYSYVAVLEGNPASSTNIVGNDYNDCGALNSPTLGSATYDVTGVSTGAYKAFDLNSDGKSWIDKAGYSTFCMRDGHDIENQSYFGPGSWIGNALSFHWF